MNNEPWINKLKNRLDNYSEPTPVGGWEALQQRLDAHVSSPRPARRLPLWSRWAAAAATLVAVWMMGWWMWQAPVVEQVAQTPLPVPDTSDLNLPAVVAQTRENDALAVHRKAEQKSKPAPTNRNQSAATVSTAVIASDRTKANSSQEIATEVATQQPAHTETHVQEVVDTQSDIEKVATKETVTKEAVAKDTNTRRRSTQDKFHLPVEHKSRKSDSRWTVGLGMSNTGGMNSNNNEANSPVMSSSSPIEMNGVAALPGDQVVTFSDGMPGLLTSRERKAADVKHRQPISAGLSVRKNLKHGLSVETGITYTLLRSDITFEGTRLDIEQKLHYIGIPVRMNWDFLRSSRFTLYVSAGGMVEKCVAGKLGKENCIVDALQWSVAGAVGAQYNISRHVGIYIEPGVGYYFDNGSKVETIRKENPCNFTLQGGIRLSY